MQRQSEIKAFRDSKRMQQAKETAAQQGEVKKQQMDDFNKRILALKTSLGSTVGELPENIQKQVLEAYKKEENK